jgi:predicted anti-sigma-YlaC factor YlaD
MNENVCASVAERLPEWAAGILPAQERDRLEAHLEACGSCRAEAELVRLLREGRPRAPDGLAERIRAGIRYERNALSRPWWGVAAAAVATLAVGIGVMSSRGGSTTVTVPAYAATADTTETSMWLSDDGLIAGAPALDELSDQALEQLLQEMGA